MSDAERKFIVFQATETEPLTREAHISTYELRKYYIYWCIVSAYDITGEMGFSDSIIYILFNTDAPIAMSNLLVTKKESE